MKRFLVIGLSLTMLVSLMASISYGDIYVICYRYGKGRCLKCKETVISKQPEFYNTNTMCHGVGKQFNSLDEAENWRARNCTCPGSK